MEKMGKEEPIYTKLNSSQRRKTKTVNRQIFDITQEHIPKINEGLLKGCVLCQEK